jgi:hypothetical protein
LFDVNEPVPGFRMDVDFLDWAAAYSVLVESYEQMMVRGVTVAETLLLSRQVPAGVEAVGIARG